MEIKVSGNIEKQVEEGITKQGKTGIKNAEKNINNTTLEVDPKTETKGFSIIQEMANKAAKAEIKALQETDTKIRSFDNNLDSLQKKLDKVGAQANEIAKKAKEMKDITNAGELIKSNTGYKSKDKAVLTQNGKTVTQLDVWNQDEQKIEKSKKLSADQKSQLSELSKLQKQLNTLKETELATIQRVQATEEKTEKDIIDQYNAAVRLNKILELMRKNQTDISDTIGNEYSSNAIANNWTSKTSIPASIEKYISGLNLKAVVGNDGDDGIASLQKELKKLYTKKIESIKAQKTSYETNKKFEEATKIVNDSKYSENLEKQGTDISKQLSSLEQSYSNRMKSLEQSTLQAIENYLKVADKDTENTYDKLTTALNNIAKYINSDGDLNTLSTGLDNILKNNPNLGKNGKGAQIFSDNLEDLRYALTGIEDFRFAVDDYFSEGKLLNPINTEQIDKTSSDLKKQIEKARNRLKENVELQQTANQYKQLISGNTQDANAQTDGLVNGVHSGIANNEIPVTVTPSIESPQAFVDEITQQLKGHSAKVDVELNSENVAEEIKKITEMIPDKKEIEVSIKSEQTDKKINKNDSISDASVTSEIQKQNKLQKELQETDEQVQRIMYHYGKLNRSLGGKESHQFGDEIAAYAEGKRNGNRGWADGTGTYVTNDATEFGFMQKDDLKKFFALDTSKLKLYEAHVEEEAQRFYEFQHKLEQFVLALGSGFTGFDDNISNIDSETLYKEATSIFSKYSEIFNNVFKDFEEFDAFIDEMINLTSISGMNENGIEAKNAKKLLNFKKENGIDDIKTRFLKKLGFQGTDLSGTSYGGIQTGSVIFDIEEAPVVASGKTITEVLEQIGITAEDTKYKINEINSNEVPSFSQNNSVNELENDLKAIYQLIDKIELEDIIGENFNTVYAEKDLLNLISLLKEIDKLTGQTSDYSHLTEGYESKYFKPSYFSEFMDGVKPESDEWYGNESSIREAQQMSIMSTIGANDVADMYAALLDERIAPTIKSKIEEMFTLDPKALRKHFEDYGGIIRNAIGGDAYYNLEDRLYPDQSDNLNPQNNLENHSSAITENLKEQDAKINIVPNIENPQEFANEVTAQLKGVKAEINVTPKITDKDISKLIGEQKKSKPTITDAPKLNANGLIDKYNLKRKDIDTSVAAKVKELSKSINSLTADVIETNSDNTWESLVQHIRELGNVLNSFGKIKLDNAQFESVLKVAEQLKGSRVFINDNIKNDILSTASVDNLRQLNNEFINLGVTFTVTKEQATNLDNVWDEFIQETNRFDLSDISTGAERITAVIEELREAKQVLYGEKGYVSAESYGSSDMVTYLEQIEKAQQKQAKANPDQSALYQKTIDAIRREKQALTELISEVSNVTTSVDDKTNAFREEEQVVTGTVQREIGELERLAGQLRSVQDDVEKIATTITSLPKIDFDVDLSKLNIENIDGASIASFNSFREQLAGLEAQLNVSNLSSKLVEISNTFTTLSGLKLDNLNTKNLKLTPITNLTKKSEDINTLVDTLDALGECLERLKNDGSFDKEYFAGLKFSAKNVNNMADMAVALETVGIALRQFDKEAKDALSSINKLAENAKGLKNLSSIIKAPKKVKKVQEAIENEDKPKGPTTAQTNKANTIDDNISNGTYEKELKQVEQRYAKLQDTVDITQGKAKELSEAFKDLKEADTVESKIQAFDNFKNALASAKNELTGLEKERSTKSFTDEVNTQLKSIQEQYSNSSYLKNSLSSLETEIERISASAKDGSADLTNLGKQAKTAFANFQKGVLPSGDFKGTFSGLEDAVEQAKKTVDSYSKVKSELKTPLQLNDDGIAKMTAQVIDFNGQLKNLTFVYNDTTKSMVQQTTNVRTELLGIPGVVDAIKHKLKDMAVYWTATLFDPYDILSSFRQVAEVVIDLNSQMTELAKVSGLSIDQLENRFGKWANTAKELGATVSDTISASADWSRLGYSIDEAEKLAEVAILYKNVGDGIDIEAANESLVSTMQGFQLEANQAESVIDSFNEVDLFASCYSNVVACINFT